MARKKISKPDGNSARPQVHFGFEATLWATADKLRGNLDANPFFQLVLA